MKQEKLDVVLVLDTAAAEKGGVEGVHFILSGRVDRRSGRVKAFWMSANSQILIPTRKTVNHEISILAGCFIEKCHP